MDWDKAKRIVIIVLILLNMGLFALNRERDSQYTISQAEEKAIFQVLGEKTIGIYTDIIREFYPMRQIHITAQALELERLRKVFFSADEEVTLTVEFNHTILKSRDKTLDVSGTGFAFQYEKEAASGLVMTKESSQEAAETILKQLGGSFSDFILDQTEKTGAGYRFLYYDTYKGNKIFNSYADIIVSGEGVAEIKANCYAIDGFSGDKLNICSADEALFTFLKQAAYEQKRANIFVEKIEIGYDFQDKSEIEEGRKMKLIPVYRIQVSGDKAPYIINAYTNELISSPMV